MEDKLYRDLQIAGVIKSNLISLGLSSELINDIVIKLTEDLTSLLDNLEAKEDVD